VWRKRFEIRTKAFSLRTRASTRVDRGWRVANDPTLGGETEAEADADAEAAVEVEAEPTATAEGMSDR
jgi:hypothetical protein